MSLPGVHIADCADGGGVPSAFGRVLVRFEPSPMRLGMGTKNPSVLGGPSVTGRVAPRRTPAAEKAIIAPSGSLKGVWQITAAWSVFPAWGLWDLGVRPFCQGLALFPRSTSVGFGDLTLHL